MTGLLAWTWVAALAAALVVVVVLLVRRPLRDVLTANRHLAPASPFYARTFVLVVSLAALAVVAGTNVPCPQQSAEKGLMEWIWWGVGQLQMVGWTVAAFLMGYVVLLTILYAVLGRYRDQ
jgi:ABC-type Fe3+-siderophore transport system permease subunit